MARALLKKEVEVDTMVSTTTIDNSTLQPANRCLMGSLESWPLPEIISWLHDRHQSAMVRVGGGMRAGILFFKHGQLFRCEWGSLLGESALLGLLELKRAPFLLVMRDPPDAHPNVRHSTPELLFRLAVARDQSRPAYSG